MRGKIPIIQKNLPMTHPASGHVEFISTYRVQLVRDRQISFESKKISSSKDALPVVRKLIETHGQSDREQFCVVMLDIRNQIIGLNIVSTGTLSSAQVHVREVLKPIILASAFSVLFCHNHPSSEVDPSQQDIDLTMRLIRAAHIIGIKVHEHLIISMHDDAYFSFADNGLIKQIYDSLK